MKLQAMRARLRALAGRERTRARDTSTRSRAEPSARSARDAEHRRRDLIVHGLSLACAAALVFAVIARLEGDAPVIPRSRSPRREPGPTPQGTSSSRAEEARAQGGEALSACDGAANLTFSLDAQRRLDLGSRALLVANHGAVVAAAQSAECDLRVGLADGSLAVHARDLQGRAMVVQTSRGEVRVKGTIFLVDFYAASGELEVGVEEGHVELVVGQGKSVMLEPGQAAYLGSHLELEPFDDSARARVRRMLGLDAKRARQREPRAEAPQPEVSSEPSQEMPVRVIEPPAQQPERSVSTTEEARPMAKPKPKRRSEARRREPEPPQAGPE